MEPTEAREPTEPRQAPDRLKGRSAEIWEETAKELHELFGMTCVDYVLLERYCHVSAQLEVIASKLVGNETSIGSAGSRRTNPLSTLYIQLMKQQTSYAAQLGIGIAARIRTQRLANTGNGKGTPGSKKAAGSALIKFAMRGK
jgi:P27 family predicted phage terminase small subunit